MAGGAMCAALMAPPMCGRTNCRTCPPPDHYAVGRAVEGLDRRLGDAGPPTEPVADRPARGRCRLRADRDHWLPWPRRYRKSRLAGSFARGGRRERGSARPTSSACPRLRSIQAMSPCPGASSCRRPSSRSERSVSRRTIRWMTGTSARSAYRSTRPSASSRRLETSAARSRATTSG